MHMHALHAFCTTHHVFFKVIYVAIRIKSGVIFDLTYAQKKTDLSC